MAVEDAAPASYDFIVVGSGAGGGTVAARLAEAGFTVLVLEAGGDPLELQGDNPAFPGQDRIPADYEVPAFHPFATENSAIRWDFFVRHYTDPAQQERDPKYVRDFLGKPVNGVFYPRTGALGGCTSHNAMIMVYPHNEDWQYIADLTGDDSWNPDAMRTMFERLENCHHRWGWRLLYWLSFGLINPTRHGFNGWLRTQKAIPLQALGDAALVNTLIDSAGTELRDDPNSDQNFEWLLQGQGDPNDWRLVKKQSTGLRYPPLMTHRHARGGTRERLLDVARKHPGRLHIKLNALVTRVLFDAANRAIGVEYRQGEKLYAASYGQQPGDKKLYEVFAAKEVILAGGAFNTPQMLMLSGVGPRETLETFGIEMRVDLPGVGKNLQDRYEVGVVTEMTEDWEVLRGAKFAPGDPQYTLWKNNREGVYTTNGAILAAIRRSRRDSPLPDLFCFGLLGKFYGYYPGYSKNFPEHLNMLTWAILKAHTLNRGGVVTLRSADPSDRPEINFHYFEEGSDKTNTDIDSVVDGIRFARRVTQPLYDKKIAKQELLPGADKQTDEELRSYVRDQAWGHHASCSCPIGDATAGGVLTSDFKVHGTEGLRVVDASAFPRIPGFFILSAVYMIGEKAADAIIRQYRQTNRGTR